MSKSNQHDNQVDSGNVAFKRSRARKYPRPDEEGSKYILLNPRIIHNIEGGDNALVPPGFEAAIQQPQSRGTLKFELTNVEEGQEISVVVDRIYRDGFWVSFKDVNSGRTLRGLICDTKHYFPVVDENKVILGVPMLPKHIAPFLPECLTQVPKSEVMTQASQGRGKRVLNDIPIVNNSSTKKKIEIIDLEEEELELDQPMPMQGLRSLEHSASASTSSKMTKLMQDEQSGEPKAEELGIELDDGGSTGQSNK